MWMNGSVEDRSPPVYYHWLRMPLVLKLLMIGAVRLLYSSILSRYLLLDTFGSRAWGSWSDPGVMTQGAELCRVACACSHVTHLQAPCWGDHTRIMPHLCTTLRRYLWIHSPLGSGSSVGAVCLSEGSKYTGFPSSKHHHLGCPAELMEVWSASPQALTSTHTYGQGQALPRDLVPLLLPISSSPYWKDGHNKYS